jgi:calcineurin-like phosphoesterase family protein
MSEQKGTRIKVWFTSDLHFGHKSVLYFHPERREAAGITLEELQEDNKAAIIKHDEWLIEKWNKTISKEDFVYILGDFCLGNKEYTEKILNRLRGRKFLIKGNHDKSCQGLEHYFQWVGDIKEAKFSHNQYKFIKEGETFAVEMCHFPMFSWNRRPHGTSHLHGHCHGSIDEYNDTSNELRIDVGFDGNFSKQTIISLEDVYNKMCEIISKTDSQTFEEHVEKIMLKQGFRA